MYVYPMKLPRAEGTWDFANTAIDSASRVVVRHVNAAMKRDPGRDIVRQFDKHELARDTDLPLLWIELILRQCCAGDNGITIVKGDLDRALDASSK